MCDMIVSATADSTEIISVQFDSPRILKQNGISAFC